MYVCICHAVTENHIAAAVEDGAANIEDLSLSLGLGSCCGSCVEVAGNVLDRHTGASALADEPPADALGVHQYLPNASY